MPQLPHIIFMSTTTIKPWVESVILHPDVLSPDFSEDIFALDLGPLADGNKNVPAVYRDPEQFFRASYLKERSDSCALGEDELKRRLKSHLIPFDQLAIGPFDANAPDFKEHVAADYQSFLAVRAALLAKAARLACDGRTSDIRSVAP
jgi:hypothetical protein